MQPIAGFFSMVAQRAIYLFFVTIKLFFQDYFALSYFEFVPNTHF